MKLSIVSFLFIISFFVGGCQSYSFFVISDGIEYEIEFRNSKQKLYKFGRVIYDGQTKELVKEITLKGYKQVIFYQDDCQLEGGSDSLNNIIFDSYYDDKTICQ